MLLFDEDSEGNVIEVAPQPTKDSSPQAEIKTPEKHFSLRIIEKQDQVECPEVTTEPPSKTKVDDGTGKLANVPITSYYGSQLNDQ